MWKCYQAFQDAKVLRPYTVRVEGRLVGYSVWTVGHNLHHETIKQANCDVIFCLKEIRGRFAGVKLLKWCIAALRAEGVVSWTLGIKLSHNWGRMAERLGFVPQETIYRLGAGADA